MNKGKTGIIYDSHMLNHKSRRKHFQVPARVQVIMSMLEQKHYLTHPKIEYVNNIKRLATDEQLNFAHPLKYINFCKNLWPKSSHRTDMTVLDTYFNQHSENIARMAVGGLLTAIDKVLNKQWENGFAVIRPPGHHSGAKNTINGFCIYNNVAIGAIYAQKKHKLKKIAIFDWDVHHGDGTQHIMKNNQNILFISIHRYDKGTFYPAGDDGNYTNNGQGHAKGTKINIPLDFVDEKFNSYNFQAPGDNQYIYIYHRLIQPILKEFDPELILISAGFDAARFDPLGGFTVTPNAYYYMTKKILQLGKHTVAVLQGGYNLISTKQAAQGVVKALIKQDTFPEQMLSIKAEHIKQVHLKNACSLHNVYHQQFDSIIQFHSQYWKCLKTEELIKYTQRVKQNKEKIFGIVQDQSSSDGSASQDSQKQEIFLDEGQFLRKKQEQNHKKHNLKNKNSQKDEQNSGTTQFYFAAGHMQRFKNFSLNNQKIYKWAYESQIKFFQSNFEQKKFAPKFYGIDQNYIIIQNLLYKQKNCVIMDIKLSRQSKNPFISEQKRQKQKKKQLKSTADKLSFRISGYTTATFKEGGIMTYSQEQVKQILKKVVDSSNKNLFKEYLNEMQNTFKNIKRKYWGTSIVLIKGEMTSAIRWIDFHYWTQQFNEVDNDLIEGIQNLKEFIIQID